MSRIEISRRGLLAASATSAVALTSTALSPLPSANAATTPRWKLPYGRYIPSASTTGPVWSKPYKQVRPARPDDVISITKPGTYQGIEYFGRVRIKTKGVIFRNCIFRGPDMTHIPEMRGCIENYGSNPPHFIMVDSLIDPSRWGSRFGASPNQAWLVGVHGGNFTLRRNEIKNVQDGINYIGPNGSLAAAKAAYCLMEGNWIHRGYYINNWYGPKDGQPHGDGFQTNTGKNITLRGNRIGGNRAPLGYGSGRLAGSLPWGKGRNLGDDFFNAAIMLKQEVDDSAINRIENVLIEKNWLGGGVATINHAFVSNRPHGFANTRVRYNKFYRRGSNWGNYSPSGEGGAGYYLSVWPQFERCYSSNTIKGTTTRVLP